MARGADVGATLGVRITNLVTRAREDSLGRTTPAVVKMASDMADALAARRAEVIRAGLVDWLRGRGVNVPPEGELGGLLGFVTKAGGWLAQNVIGTAIGFGVGSSLSAVLNPYFAGLVQDAWRSNPIQVLSPAELALAVLRGHLDQGPAAAEAAASGIDPERFQTMVDNTGEPPGIEAVLGLWRRGKVTDAELERAVRQSRVRNEWLATIRELGIQWPSWSEFLDAYLEGQVEESEARALYARAGGDPDLFDLLFNTRGQAPTPSQALDLLNRGIIPQTGRGPAATSYEQAFLEGPWRNKWLEPFLGLREYVVPPRSVAPMVRSGAWDAQRGIEELMKSGVTPDTAAAIVSEAKLGKLGTERELTKADVIAGYRDGLMSESEATTALGDLGYQAEDAAFLLAVADHAWEVGYRNAAVNRLRGLYVKGSITEDEASGALAQLGVGGRALSKYLALWDIERELPRAELTLAQLQAAFRQGLLTEAELQDKLAAKGYDPSEVAILVALTVPRGA